MALLGAAAVGGFTVPSLRPAQVLHPQLAGGGYSAYAIGAEGRVWAWGDGLEGQLGDGLDGVFSPVPSPVLRLWSAVAVTATSNSAFALRRDGTVWGWGDNDAGELGDGHEGSASTRPVQVRGLRDVVSLAGGDFSAYALQGDGKVWAWGDNAFGQIGAPLSLASSSVPLRVSELKGVHELAAGSATAYALDGNGKVWAWGDDAFGELARPSRVIVSSAPLLVAGPKRVIAIAASSYTAFALAGNGSVWAWGDDSVGELGTGRCELASSGVCPAARRPVRVSGLSRVVAIAAGGNAAYALEANGTVWAWGYGGYGQLGDGSTKSSDVPVQARVRGIARR